MAKTRVELHKILTDILGSKYVYFQPPETLKMQYPCIVYRLSGHPKRSADNLAYHGAKAYQVIIIDRDPDSKIPDKLWRLANCSFERFYTAENLNHFVFNIYF